MIKASRATDLSILQGVEMYKWNSTTTSKECLPLES